MALLPKIRCQVGDIGNELWVQFPDISDNEKTYFDADEAVGQTTLSASGTNFSANDYVVLGQQGSEKTEIVLLGGASATTLTSGATVFAHERGDKIQFIPFNQIVVERSTDSGVSFTPLSAVNIRPDALETFIQRPTDATTDVYRVRFYNSTSALYSAYSDNLTASGYADNTVWAIKHRALQELGETLGGKITDQFLNETLWSARRKVDKKIFRWSFRTAFNTDIGDCIPGRWSIAVPTDLRDPNTNTNILGLRVGRVGRSLVYQDAREFAQNYTNVAHSTLNGAITGASTSIILTSSGDFDEDGSLDIAAESIAGTVDNVLYTANNEVTKTLSGVTSIADSHASGRDVWQGVTFGSPTCYTINAGMIYFDRPFEDELAGENIFMDYYKDVPVYDSDGDILDETEYDFFVSYLKWRIKDLKAGGVLSKGTDSDYQDWEKHVQDFVDRNVTGQLIKFIPS